MPTRSFFSGLAGLTLLALLALPDATVRAQSGQPTAGASPEQAAIPVAREAELNCAGFIQHTPVYSGLEIIGGEQEQEQNTFAEGDYLYIRGGAQQAVRVGDEFTVLRPRGQFRSPWTKKRGSLGVYTQELGRVRVVRVKEQVSVALVTSACDTLLLGDLLRAMPQRVSPPATAEGEFDRFADPTGKQQGRIVAARDYRETLTRSHVVYIDLGAEDNVKVGDRLTVWRPVGRGNISRFRDDEVSPAGSGGFESFRFKGGKLSNKARRAKDPNRTGVRGPTVSRPEIERRRPALPRKIVGEMVILDVQQRAATAIITRVAQEIHTGDFVEVQ